MYNNFSSKKTKKVISALLATALVATSAPITADAATPKTVGVGKSIKVTASSSKDKVTGLSKKEKNIVKVTKKGTKVTIKGKKAGKVTFKIGKKAYTVKVGATSITKKTVTTSMKVGQKKTLSVNAVNGKGDTIQFTSSKKSVVKVNKASAKATAKKVASTTVTAVKAGTAKITAKSKYTGKSKTFTIKVAAAPVATTPAVASTPAVVATTPAATATVTNAPSNPSGDVTKAPTTTSGAATTAPTETPEVTSGAATKAPTENPDETKNPNATATPEVTSGASTATPEVTSGAATATPEVTDTPTVTATSAAINVTTNVSDVTVNVISGTSIVTTASITATTGASITDVANGTYTVEFVKNGYKKDTKLVTVNGEDVVVDVTLEKLFKTTVDEINASGVTLVLSDIEETVTAYVPTVTDNKGNVVAVTAADIAKGTTATVTFTFATSYTEKQEGVWYVDGIAYDFTEAANVRAIVEAAQNGNQVSLINALTKAEIKDVNEDLIADYVAAIDTANNTAALKTYAAVQKVIDKANTDASAATEKAAVIKELKEAKSDLSFFKVLKANFERVNDDWSTAYLSGVTGTDSDSVIGFIVNGTANEYVADADGSGKAKTFGTAGTTAEFTTIQTIIDTINKEQIVDKFNRATTAEAQDAVTTLIDTWFVADDENTPSVTPKANIKRNSQIKSAGLTVKEAKNATALYNALVAYAKITPDSILKESELNDVLKADYYTALEANKADLVAFDADRDELAELTVVLSAEAGTKTIKADIVTQGETAALKNALLAIYGKGTEGSDSATKKDGGLTTTSTTADVKAALQKVADVTAHQTGANKFDMSTVRDDQLANYRTEFVKLANLTDQGITTQAANRTTVANLAEDISSVNDAIYINIVIQSKDAAEVKDAILQLAIKNISNDDNGAAAAAFINLTDAEKDEIVAIINTKKATDTANSFAYNELDEDKLFAAGGTTASDLTSKTITAAKALHDATIAKFNAIGDLANASTTGIVTALGTYVADSYVADTDTAKAYSALGSADKLAVANYIKGLTNVSGTGDSATKTPKNFGGTDAVMTIAEANAYIADAIASLSK